MSATASPDPTSQQARTPRPRRSNPSRRPNDQTTQRTVAGGRNFGGQLTRLHADAPAFVPASLPPQLSNKAGSKPHSDTSSEAGSKSARSQPVQQRRRGSLLRSTAPDIATRTHEDISKGIYECAICTNEISRRSRVWSCHTCWTVFHIGCIKTWSKNDGAAMPQQHAADAEQVQVKQWRCPGCNLPKEALPSSYNCWCEKEMSPKIITGIPPHSCGQTCGRKRVFPKACPHPCDLLCHAGPCPPCTSMGPRQVCFCGKESTSRKCSETNYDLGWSCGQICGDVMPCTDHTCPQPCHEGLCGACEVEVDSRCYCGKVERKIQCNEKEEQKESFDWTGVFNCLHICERLFDCGKHKCEKLCHPQDDGVPHCSKAPDMISRCPCGKTELGQLSKEPRKSCSDPIPQCEKHCGKMMSCGHACEQRCHSGECPTCLCKVSITCRCGRNSFETVCQQGALEPPQCFRVCKATLNCSRHECGEHCCTGERKAIERQATKRKLKPLGSIARMIDEGIESEHICTRTCSRLLKCGNHACPELCHKGPCNSCREAIFEDLNCNCGRTVLQAPLPCGTYPPPCTFPCHRTKTCGHPQVAHNCHLDDETCPNCPYLTEKSCLCGKKTLKNQPCWRSDVLCGLICGKTLKCGSHACQKLCHRPGDCEDASTPCQQSCGKPKKICGHPCERVCHAPSACKEDKPCPSKVIITCDCQRKKEEVRCNAKAGVPIPSGRQASLKCDDECARLERNRKLALALHIADDHTDDHVPYSTSTLHIYLEDVAWAYKQEQNFRLFAADDDEKRLRLPPMKRHQRTFIHSLAEDFGFDSESVDPEPHRHILLFKTPKFVAAPMKTLAQAARIKRVALNVSAPVASLSERKANEAQCDYNGLLLSNLRFALTDNEIRSHLAKAASATEFDIVFMPSTDSLALIPSRSWEAAEQSTAFLNSLLPSLATEITKTGLAGSVALCLFDLDVAEPRVLHQQGKQESTRASSGWSRVAARRGAPVQVQQAKPVGQRPVYTVLGSRLAEAKKKKLEDEERSRQKAEVVENWEMEADVQDETTNDSEEVTKRATQAAKVE